LNISEAREGLKKRSQEPGVRSQEERGFRVGVWFLDRSCEISSLKNLIDTSREIDIQESKETAREATVIFTPDSWLLAPDSWILIPDSWLLIPDSWLLIPDSSIVQGSLSLPR